MATKKTARQVKTVLIIFIAFVFCWSPYVFVLLYDRSDSLPLSVHLYTSMLAHLHASLNFAIYSLNNRDLNEDCQHLVEQLAACCRRMSPSNPAAVAVGVYSIRSTPRVKGRRAQFIRGLDDVNGTLVTADVECYQMQEMVA